jgi:DNA polymerase
VTEDGERQAALDQLRAEAEACTLCSLAGGRTNVVFGSGNADARLMFVGEAPGYHEDRQGKPFVGQAGKLLESLLARIGMSREDVYIANVLKCRPPGNRDPLFEEIESCRSYLDRQIAIIEPLVICTLGNFSTKLLSGRSEGITRVHGAPQPMPDSDGAISLYPVFHPAAALYTPANLQLLEQDFDNLPRLLGGEPPDDSVLPEGGTGQAVENPSAGHGEEETREPEQLDLF